MRFFIAVLAATTLLAACAAPKPVKQDTTIQPTNVAPTPADGDERATDDGVSSEAEMCSTDDCQKYCGEYSGGDLARCYDAWKNGCFTSPEEGYDCEEFGAGESIEAKEEEAAPGAGPDASPAPTSDKKRKAKDLPIHDP